MTKNVCFAIFYKLDCVVVIKVVKDLTVKLFVKVSFEGFFFPNYC